MGREAVVGMGRVVCVSVSVTVSCVFSNKKTGGGR